MTTKQELLVELAANRQLIEAQIERINFLAQLRGQPQFLIHTLMALNKHHPEITQQLRELQQATKWPLMQAMDYLQGKLMPWQLLKLCEETKQLESQLELLITQEQEASNQESQPDAETGKETPPTAENGADETQDRDAATAVASSTSEDHEEQEKEREENDEQENLNAGSRRKDGNGDGDGGGSSGNAGQSGKDNQAHGSPENDTGKAGSGGGDSAGDMRAKQGDAKETTEILEAGFHFSASLSNSLNLALDLFPADKAHAYVAPSVQDFSAFIIGTPEQSLAYMA